MGVKFTLQDLWNALDRAEQVELFREGKCIEGSIMWSGIVMERVEWQYNSSGYIIFIVTCVFQNTERVYTSAQMFETTMVELMREWV